MFGRPSSKPQNATSDTGPACLQRKRDTSIFCLWWVSLYGKPAQLLSSNLHYLSSVLITKSERIIAIATIYWPTFTGLERYFGILATLGTYYRKHLPPGPGAVVTIPVTPCLPGLTALRTALGLVSIAFRSKELLLPSTEGEGSPTIGTLERLAFKSHWMTSLI